MAKNLILLDLDGTVRRPKSESDFINDPDDQEIIPGVYEELESLAEANFLVGITNQKGVSLGYKSYASCVQEQCNTVRLLPFIDSVIFCPDDGEKCVYLNYSIENGDFELIEQTPRRILRLHPKG